jgi:hypothetical protein
MLLNFPTHGFIIDRDNDLTPPGGFINLMNNQPEVYHNHHLVGEPSHFVPFKPPGHFGTSPSQEETTLIHHQLMSIVRMKLLGLRNASCGQKKKMLGW